MTLWQEILSDYGDACYFMSFADLADEYNTTERAVGKAMTAIRRRGAMCGTLEYADGRKLKLKMRATRKIPRRVKRSCGCGS